MGRPLPGEDAGPQSREVTMSSLRRWLCGLLILVLIVAGFCGWLVLNARAMPVVRRAEISLPFPANGPHRPLTIALLTDTHLSGPDTDPARMGRIVDLINGLTPDLIALGGDYIGDHKGGATYGPAQSVAPFARLRAPLGVVAVLGNHDARAHSGIDRRRWRAIFGAMGIKLLDNEATRRGSLGVGGLRDIYTGTPDIPRTLRAVGSLGGAPVILSHGPDVFPEMPDQPMLLLVGHTHCGQVALPFAGIIYVPSRFGTRYACGLFREGQKTMIVSAGVGTSGLPFRLLSPPDIWLVTIRPK